MKSNNDAGWLDDKKNREQLAISLGWFSIGLGLIEILAPRTLAGTIGAPVRPGLLRLMGLREIAAGAGILSKPRTRNWLQARVAGDAMDLGVLGLSMFSSRADRRRLAMATLAVAGVTALDVMAANSFRDGESVPTTLHIKRSLIVNRPADQLYQLWHNFQELPRFMQHLISVKMDGDRRSHWVAKGPAGTLVEWDAEIVDDRPNECIVWRSIGSGDVDHAGSVRFEPARGNRGTVVRVEMEYRPPAGRIGATVATLFGQSPKKQILMDLLRFKQMVETGEIARTEGQPAGRGKSTSRTFDDLLRA